MLMCMVRREGSRAEEEEEEVQEEEREEEVPCSSYSAYPCHCLFTSLTSKQGAPAAAAVTAAAGRQWGVCYGTDHPQRPWS